MTSKQSEIDRKREKIREEFGRLFYEAMRLSPFQNSDVLFTTNQSRANRKAKIYAEKAIYALHSQGLVIKGQSLGISHPHLANYYTVEPLIEEE